MSVCAHVPPYGLAFLGSEAEVLVLHDFHRLLAMVIFVDIAWNMRMFAWLADVDILLADVVQQGGNLDAVERNDFFEFRVLLP